MKNKQRSNDSSTNPFDVTFYILEFSLLFLVIPSIYFEQIYIHMLSGNNGQL
jgi:hypothetical protein